MECVGDRLWVGTWDNGIYVLSVEEIFERYTMDNSSLPSNRINTMYRDAAHTLWIGTDSGSTSYRNGIWRDSFRFDNVRKFAAHTANSVWMLPGYGWEGAGPPLSVNNGQNIEPFPFDANPLTEYNIYLISSFITTIEADRSGNLWIGTFGSGLATLRPLTTGVNGIATLSTVSVGFPNPTSDIFNIRVSTERSTDVTVNIHDALGRNVRTQSFHLDAAGDALLKLDIGNMPTGWYTYEYALSGKISSGTLLVTR